MHVHSSRRRRRLVLIASGLATAGLVLASAAWARLPQTASASSPSGASSAVSPARTTMALKARRQTVTITPSRPADAAGWYRNPVTFTTTGTDSRGRPLACSAPQTYGGPDVSHVAIVGTCTDAMGKIQSKTFDLRYDATAPTVTAAAGRPADRDGWYDAPVSVSFTGQDVMSGGVTCSPGRTYNGPDSADATIAGSCSDTAGNVGSGSIHLPYDATAPVVTVDADRPVDHNGWFNSPVTFSTHGSDAVSGLVACSLPVTYLAPDTAAGTLDGSCSDAAGNTSAARAQFKYDSTAPTAAAAPSSPPNGNGWYRAAFEVSFTGSDATSGPVSCSPAVSYSGPDALAASLGGTCVDGAGNSAPASYGFRYDATAPAVSPALVRAADHAGWYNHPVDTAFTGTDATSGGVSCAVASYGGPDSATASVSTSCSDAAGNSASATMSFEYDAAAPTVTATPARPPNANGWYRGPVDVSFAGIDLVSGVADCDPPVTYAGPDDAAATISGGCTDGAGNTGSGSLSVEYDATAPTVAASLGRDPDSGLWFNHAVSVSFSGTDALSNGVTCDPATSYDGPDSATASVTGTCTDAAGNTGSAAQSFAYDGTAPSVTLTAARPPDAGDAYTSPVAFDVTGSDATSGGVSCDGPITYSGPDSANATVTGSCGDAAGNTRTGSATFGYRAATATAPDTSLVSTPASLTNQTSAQFAFVASTGLSTFQCSLDGAAAAGCTSPQGYSGLADGPHTFSVAAADATGNTDATPATFAWTVDTVVPETALGSTPPDPNNGAASFTIQTDADATLECSLDNAVFTACTSPASIPLAKLPDGRHTFRARGVDGAGNIDATPASFTWTTDTVGPTINLGTTPPPISTSTTAAFGWTTNETAAFSCRIDTAAFASCGSGTSGTKTFTGLTQGTHTFNLRARDAAGNITPLPGLTFAWTVDTGPPDTDIDQASKPANPTASATASFAFTATEPSSFKCRLDNAPAFTACTSPQSYSGLADGTHTFAVEAVDTLGNVDPTPATYTWLVDTTTPTGSITVPTDGATVSGNTQQVAATAADNVSVLSVQFKLDGADLGTAVTAAPYSVTWDTTNNADGPHTLTAVIRDEVANTTTTAPVHVSVQNTTPPPTAASPDLVDVGPGSVDATTRSVIRTAAGRVYIVANDDTAAVSNPVHAATGAGVIRAYRGNQAGTPTAFAEVDGAHRPSSSGTNAFSGVDVRLGSDGIAHTLFSDNATDNVNGCIGTLLYRAFSTVSDTWATTETIDTCVGGQPRGRIKYALALDGANVPHIVWTKGTALVYANHAGGSWSTPVTIATGAPAHPMLAFDASGLLHLTWLEDNGSGSSLRYAVRTGGAWSAPELIPTGAILSNGNADQGPSIATDSAGHPYVLYVGPSQGTFGPIGHTALYGPMQVMEKVGGTWTDVSPPAAAPSGYLSHTPQIYVRGNDVYAFNGHDTDINFSYAQKLGAGSWSTLSKLTAQIVDGSASIRWDPLHETDPSIIDATTYNEDRLGDRSFLGEVYYIAVTPSLANTTAPPL